MQGLLGLTCLVYRRLGFMHDFPAAVALVLFARRARAVAESDSSDTLQIANSFANLARRRSLLTHVRQRSCPILAPDACQTAQLSHACF